MVPELGGEGFGVAVLVSQGGEALGPFEGCLSCLVVVVWVAEWLPVGVVPHGAAVSELHDVVDDSGWSVADSAPWVAAEVLGGLCPPPCGVASIAGDDAVCAALSFPLVFSASAAVGGEFVAVEG